MECAASIIQAIDFIEANLKQALTVEAIAAQAARYSVYHFVRLFGLLTGETPGSYLRKRRLTEAAREIVGSRRPIIDIAFDYQFQSQAAFARSFKNQFGIAPGEQRRRRQFLHLTPRAVLAEPGLNRLPVQSPQIVCRPPLLLVGAAYHGNNSQGELVTLWRNFSAQLEVIPYLTTPRCTYGLWFYPDSFQTTRDFDYLAAVEVERLADLPPGVSPHKLAASQYALFEHHGSLRHIRQTYLYAYGDWLPHSAYQLAGQYDLECYDERFTGADREDTLMSILIPICARSL